MKKKKGFTLIEIIICIGMLAVIAVGSIVGIHLVNKNLTIKELNQITNKAIQAAQVYIETNKAAQTQLYTEQNAVKIPIKVLVNEGLLSLKGTKLDEKNIENEYVITALSTESNSSTECTNIDSKASWDNDKVIYICTNLNSKGEVTGSNLATIDPTKYGNKTNVSNEPYYFKGMEPHNYVKGGARILYVDSDDTIILVGTKNIKIESSNDSSKTLSGTWLPDNEIYNTFDETSSVNIEYGYGFDASGTATVGAVGEHQESYLGTKNSCLTTHGRYDNEYCNNNARFDYYRYYTRLDNKCKIVSGTGASDNPYVIDC